MHSTKNQIDIKSIQNRYVYAYVKADSLQMSGDTEVSEKTSSVNAEC